MPSVRISISPYLKEFLIDKYGPEPVSFPQNTMFMRHITEGCAPQSVKSLSESSKQEVTPKRSKVYISVCLPDTVFRAGKVVQVNDNWNLNYDSCRSFRRTTDTMFWVDCEAWITDYFRARRANNEFYSRENAIRDFMVYHRINMNHDETIIRQYKRRAKELKQATNINHIKTSKYKTVNLY